MTFRGPGMPLGDSARFDVARSDFHRFELGELIEVGTGCPWPWIVTRINTVTGTVDLTPLPSWEAFKQGRVKRRPVDVPNEYGQPDVATSYPDHLN